MVLNTTNLKYYRTIPTSPLEVFFKNSRFFFPHIAKRCARDEVGRIPLLSFCKFKDTNISFQKMQAFLQDLLNARFSSASSNATRTLSGTKIFGNLRFSFNTFLKRNLRKLLRRMDEG